MAWPLIAAAAISLAGGLVNSIIGGGKAAHGLQKGAVQLTKFDQDLLDYMTTLAAPEQALTARGLGVSGLGAETLQSTLQALREQALNPTVSPGFRLTAEEGLRQIAQNFATTGAPDSGPAQIAAGRFLTGLAANERDRQLQTLYNVAQAGAGILGGGQATEAALGFGGLRTNLFGQRLRTNENLAELFGAQGLQQAKNIAGIAGSATEALGKLQLFQSGGLFGGKGNAA